MGQRKKLRQAHRRTGAQAHRRTGAQAHRRTDEIIPNGIDQSSDESMHEGSPR